MISIIVVTYNTLSLTRRCVRSVLESNISIPFEIVLVDNNSSDGTVAAIREEFPDVIIIDNKDNKMFAKANNQGMKLARGDFFLLLNSDAFLTAGVVERLVDFLVKNDRVGVVGPKILNEDGSLQSQGYPFAPLAWTIVKNFNLDHVIPWSFRRRLFPWLDASRTLPTKTGWVSGACMLIRKTAVDKVGGLHEGLFFYGEEVEWCWRANKVGYETWCLPDVSVIHLGGASSTKLKSDISEERRKKQMESTLVLVKSTTGIPFNLVCSSIIISSGFIKLFLFLFSRSKRLNNLDRIRSEWSFVKLQLSDLLKGT